MVNPTSVTVTVTAAELTTTVGEGTTLARITRKRTQGARRCSRQGAAVLLHRYQQASQRLRPSLRL
jgi:hypothetical protein